MSVSDLLDRPPLRRSREKLWSEAILFYRCVPNSMTLPGESAMHCQLNAARTERVEQGPEVDLVQGVGIKNLEYFDYSRR
jgi:hypothetical protein